MPPEGGMQCFVVKVFSENKIYYIEHINKYV